MRKLGWQESASTTKPVPWRTKCSMPSLSTQDKVRRAQLQPVMLYGPFSGNLPTPHPVFPSTLCDCLGNT